eukprot:TRINITY_DN8489_c1_g1_i1.p1 TRINITY_DN8489_c1_g1~~TRINITY_DN8489_c1_g1_i1.p1  ORF type:complete len:217 (-),score=20.97 TRINITY_DN8489_c1_g1_i1:293-943(-)
MHHLLAAVPNWTCSLTSIPLHLVQLISPQPTGQQQPHYKHVCLLVLVECSVLLRYQCATCVLMHLCCEHAAIAALPFHNVALPRRLRKRQQQLAVTPMYPHESLHKTLRKRGRIPLRKQVQLKGARPSHGLRCTVKSAAAAAVSGHTRRSVLECWGQCWPANIPYATYDMRCSAVALRQQQQRPRHLLTIAARAGGHAMHAGHVVTSEQGNERCHT